MKPRHTAEQSTTSVNKATQIGKVGFAALKFKTSTDTAPQTFAAPLQKTLEIPHAAPAKVVSATATATPDSEPAGPLFASVVEVPVSPVSAAPVIAHIEAKVEKPKGFMSLESLKNQNGKN